MRIVSTARFVGLLLLLTVVIVVVAIAMGDPVTAGSAPATGGESNFFWGGTT